VISARKEQLRGLLRMARARIEPTEVGLREPRQRRNPGLRREDVAVLAGVSVKWYTWLEQGRDINFSTDVLERVAAALRLSPAERAYLFGLTQWRLQRRHPRDETVSDMLWRTVHYAPVPTMIMTLRWDILEWNGLIARIFRDYGTVRKADRNLLRIALTDRKYLSDPLSFDVMARKLIGEFRVDFGQCAGDPAFEELIAELKVIAPGFTERWNRIEIFSGQRGTVVQHDEFGDLTFDRISYVPEGGSALRVLMFVPRDAQTAALVAALREQENAPPERVVCAEPEDLRHTNR
jgi:transcriptional regulator with XRE-family HTH domain